MIENSVKKYSLAVLNPGHFHAALSLRVSHPYLSDDVYVYSRLGPELDTFMGFIQDFNSRQKAPTQWKIHLESEGDLLNKLITDKKADIVVLAGRNNIKMEYIEALNKVGFHIFSDKPLVTNVSSLPKLKTAFSPGRALSQDIMTERFEITTILQKKFIQEQEIFGMLEVDDSGTPTIFKESVHHLYKIVNGKPLKRPTWYFDVNIQGEGILDVTTHLVDMTHWMLFPEQSLDFDNDIVLDDAQRWPTSITEQKYAEITQENSFPTTISDFVDGGVLKYYCNGELKYHIKGVPVQIRVLWNLQAPQGGGDTHYSRIRGTFADLVVRQLPEKKFLSEFVIEPHVASNNLEVKINSCLERWKAELPGLKLSKEGSRFIIDIPDSLRTSHEEHFCEARDAFLDMLVNNNEPVEARPNIIAKYTLLAMAREKAITGQTN